MTTLNPFAFDCDTNTVDTKASRSRVGKKHDSLIGTSSEIHNCELTKPKILILHEKPGSIDKLKDFIKDSSYEIKNTTHPEKALSYIIKNKIDQVVVNCDGKGELCCNFLEAADKILPAEHQISIIACSNRNNVERGC